jgi:hypothetical protein
MIFGMLCNVFIILIFAFYDGLQYVEFTERETKMRKGQGAPDLLPRKCLHSQVHIV